MTSRNTGVDEALYEYDLAAESLTRLFPACEEPLCFVDEPAYSPDGATLAFIRYLGPLVDGIPSDCSLWMGDLASGEIRQLTSNPGCDREYLPRWAPDGTQLTHWRWREDASGTTGTAVFVIDADSTNERPLTEWEDFAGDPDWSPDGEWIVYGSHPLLAFSDVPAISNLFRMHPDGTGIEQLTFNEDPTQRATQPRYTPDGESIVFTAVVPTRRELRVMPADGGEPYVVAVGSIHTHGTWQPAPGVAEVHGITADATTDGLSLVGLGDSLPGALGCSTSCRSYVQVYGELAAESLGVPVAATNLATNDGLESSALLERVQTDPRHREAVARADIVTVQIGLNDWQGVCMWDGMAECLAADAAVAEKNLTAILDEILVLRDGLPTATRVVTYFDPYVGTLQAPEWWGFDPSERDAFEAAFSAALTDFNSRLCGVAEDHDAICIDSRTPFNGPDWNMEALPEPADGALVLGGEHHLHMTASGHQLVARALADSGFAPLVDGSPVAVAVVRRPVGCVSVALGPLRLGAG